VASSGGKWQVAVATAVAAALHNAFIECSHIKIFYGVFQARERIADKQ